MNPREQWRLDTARVGRRVLVFDELDSTNTRAALLPAEPENDGLILIADVQSGGRGQYGRSWQCPPRSGLLMSVLLLPPPQLRRPALLTAWAAVSVCETLRDLCGVSARIKWPNDVLVHDRKVCGILIEASQCGMRNAECGVDIIPHSAFRTPHWRVVAGVGLNLNQTAVDFEAAGLPQAGSLLTVTGRTHDRDDVARRLLRVMDEEYERLRQGDLGTLEQQWRRRVGLLGRTVRAECLDGVHEGRLMQMTWDGLYLEQPGGEGPRILAPETVRGLTEIV